MIVTLIGKKGINSITLPQRIRGQYWLYDPAASKAGQSISIEGINNEWILKSNRSFKILDSSNKSLKDTVLAPLEIKVIKRSDDERAFVFTEPVTSDRQIFTKYLIREDIELRIGRGEQNDIIYNNGLTSSSHAVLLFSAGKWNISDAGSTNGTFVNGKRVGQSSLEIGDLIYIMGLKLVIGKSFIAINNPDGKVLIKPGKVQRFINQELTDNNSDYYDTTEADYYSRSPRFKRDIKTAEFKIDTPPQSPLSNEMPWLLIMGSSIAMGMMSLTTLISAIASNNIMSMIMGASMLFGTVLLPSIAKKYERSQKEKKEQLRQKKYKEYLDQIATKINEECQKQESILRENFLHVNMCINRIKNVESTLWERGIGQNDFMRVRLGLGSSKLDAHLSYSERRFTIDEDNLQEELYTLCEAPKKLNNVPITISLYENHITGVIGSESAIAEIAKSIIFQLCSYYGYDEVKFVFLMSESISEEFNFVRWLPHIWRDDRELRFIAYNYDEVKELSSYLEKEIELRIAKNDDERADIIPYYVVFVFSDKLSGSAEFLKQIYSQHSNLNLSVINFARSFTGLPKECSNVVEIISELEGRVFDRNGNYEEVVSFVPDKISDVFADELSKKLANTFLDIENQKYTLPKMLTFLDMYGVGKIEHLNPLTRWNENDPTLSLAVPVGVDTSGRLFKIDLHEKYHGPHGLVAGMTGSGKSEFIITYILSMAVNYHPNEVAFILIDYKGGGLAGAFVDPERGIKLPHIAGTITNLDGASINRSLISIQSELRRRQAIFNTARKVSNEGTMDIYIYQKLYRRGVVSEPLPHLFIISDEFAELKTQQPEFMDQLISAARIGRSLGVHLILATQKPNGVVDDQIWSNSRFRVCLKVQEKADSMDMIKRPDAASLSDTGRFYMQVGFNEFFDLGQSAWCGSSYSPSEKVSEKYDNSVRFIDNLGQTLAEVKPKDKNLTGAEVKQIVAMVKYLSDIADEDHIAVKPLWLDPIPEKIYVNELSEKYGYRPQVYYLNPIIGEYDDPFNQRQQLMTLSISRDGHAILYGSTGNGTETAIETLIYSIISMHSADEVNLYILDFGAETLEAFSKAPQVGDVLFSSDEEKISNLFKMLNKEMEKRKKTFSEFGGNYSSFIDKSNEKLPNIVVIINSFVVFAEMFEQQEDGLVSLTRECQKYGIYFILSANAGNAIRYRLQQNFKQLLVLQMNDQSDYIGILGQTDGVCPSKIYGRGIVKYDKVYEFQTALAAQCDDIMEFYRDYSEKLLKNSTSFARKVPILPDVVDLEFVSSEITDISSVPVGVNRHNLLVNKVNFGDRVVSMVLSEDNKVAGEFISSLADVLARIVPELKIIDALSIISEGNYRTINNDIDEHIVDVFNDMVQRNNLYKEAGMDASVLSEYPEKVIILFGFKHLLDQLMDDTSDKLKVLLEKAELEYKYHFIIVDEASSVSSYSFHAWYKKQVSSNDGIWVGNGIYDQFALKLNRAVSSGEDIGLDFGYVVNRGRETLIKLLHFQDDDLEDYANE